MGLDFNGTDQKVGLGDITGSVDFDDAFTISAWIKLNSPDY